MTAPNPDDELDAAMIWLVGRLNADTDVTALLAGRVFDDAPPPDTLTPYLQIGIQAAPDVAPVDGTIILTEVLARVVAVSEGGSYPSDVALAAHRAIHRQNDHADDFGGRVLACHRIQPLRYSERENDRRWRFTGALYRLNIGAT